MKKPRREFRFSDELQDHLDDMARRVTRESDLALRRLHPMVFERRELEAARAVVEAEIPH